MDAASSSPTTTAAPAASSRPFSVVDIDTGIVTRGPRALRAAWSPTGDMIAFDDPEERISVMAGDGSGTRVVASYRAATPSFAWSPDGSWILFHDSPEGGWGEVLTVVHPDGSGKRVLLREPDVGFTGGWSPDSRRLAYFGTKRKDAPSFDGTQDGLYVVSIDDPTPHALCLCEPRNPVWSPSGTAVADTIAYPNGGTELRLFSVADGAARTLGAQNASAVRWSPSGRHLAAAYPNRAILFDADGNLTGSVNYAARDGGSFSFSPER